MSAERSRPQSEPIGIGIPTGTPLGHRQRHCPGAMLRVTRDDYNSMKRAGAVFASGDKDIAFDGYSDARLHCTRDVADIRVREYERDGKQGKETVVSVYSGALCSSCADEERDNRADLLRRKGAQPR